MLSADSQDLDCQWLDVTDTPSDWYILRICVNFERTFQESTFDNNCMQFPVWVPPTVDSKVQSYASWFAASSESSARCQDLYDRTEGSISMPIVCNGLFEEKRSSSMKPSPYPPPMKKSKCRTAFPMIRTGQVEPRRLRYPN